MKKRKQRNDEEKAINAVSLFCTIAMMALGVLLFALPYIDNKGLTSLVENLATPFTLTLMFFLIENVRERQKQDKNTDE